MTGQGVDVVEAVADDHHRFALQPGAEAAAVLHGVGGDAVQHQQGDEDHEDRQQGHVFVEGDVAGGGAEGEDHQDLEQGYLPYAAPSGNLQEREHHHEGEEGAQRDFGEEAEGN